MRNIAIIYSTKYGQTEKIVDRMKTDLEKGSCVVEASNVETVHYDLGSQIDGVLIGGPVYAGRFSSALIKWVLQNKSKLMDKRLGFFTVSLNAADKRDQARKDDDRLLREFIDKTGLVPEFVASLAGALKYRDYFPLIRWQLRRIARDAGGDTDTSRNFEYTNWSAVEAFCNSFVERATDSRFAIKTRFQEDRNMNQFMREFEQHYTSSILIKASPTEAYSAFSSVRANDLKAADLLATIRTLGLAEKSDETFAQSAESFGVTPLLDDPGSEIIGGLIGKFWRLGFGIQRVIPADFNGFNQPGFTKVLTRFTFRPEASGKTRLTVTMRIHSTDAAAKMKFRVYWTALGPGIRLYMRSILRGIKRHAELEHVVEDILQAH